MKYTKSAIIAAIAVEVHAANDNHHVFAATQAVLGEYRRDQGAALAKLVYTSSRAKEPVKALAKGFQALVKRRDARGNTRDLGMGGQILDIVSVTDRPVFHADLAVVLMGLTQGAVRWFEYQYWMSDPLCLALVAAAILLPRICARFEKRSAWSAAAINSAAAAYPWTGPRCNFPNAPVLPSLTASC